MASPNPVATHYGSSGIADRILAALREVNGPDAPVTPEALAPIDHFHGRGALATEELVALLKPQPGERLLDIGSGVGGPARWIAAKFGCHVTGVDLTPEFCAAARALNEACGMTDRVTIIEGSALDLPVPDAAFDRAYSQNVIMNIADKARFYREAFRALRPGGLLALSNICAGEAGEPYFPVPWATTRDTSFLATVEQTRADWQRPGSRSSASRTRPKRRRTPPSASLRGSKAGACLASARISSWASGCVRCGSIRCAASPTGASGWSRCWRESRLNRRMLQRSVAIDRDAARR